jgi:hypothetical protein
MNVFVTTMKRWGKDASYHDIKGVYSTKADAMFARDVEVTNREGKYDYSVTECKLDVPTPIEEIEYFYQCRNGEDQGNENE